MPWKIIRSYPNGGHLREFVGKPTPEEEREFYRVSSGVRAVHHPIKPADPPRDPDRNNPEPT